MTDGIIKGAGNSRYLRTVPNAMTLYPTHEAMMEALVSGTFPIDLNGINPAGWDVVGDKLSKSTLLTDTLCTALSLPTTATPTQAMDKLRQMADSKAKFAAGSWVGTGTSGESYPNHLDFPFSPKLIGIFDSDGHLMFNANSSYPSTVTKCISLGNTSPLTTSYQQNVMFFTDETMNSSWNAWFYTKWGDESKKSVDWYVVYKHTSGIVDSGQPKYQYNESGATYYYIAFG